MAFRGQAGMIEAGRRMRVDAITRSMRKLALRLLCCWPRPCWPHAIDRRDTAPSTELNQRVKLGGEAENGGRRAPVSLHQAIAGIVASSLSSVIG